MAIGMVAVDCHHHRLVEGHLDVGEESERVGHRPANSFTTDHDLIESGLHVDRVILVETGHSIGITRLVRQFEDGIEVLGSCCTHCSVLNHRPTLLYSLP